MRTKIDDYSTIVKDLKLDYPKLTEFELLSLAIQIERNQILENGLVVSRSDSTPSGFETVAYALGYKGEQLNYTITDALKDIVNKE